MYLTNIPKGRETFHRQTSIPILDIVSYCLGTEKNLNIFGKSGQRGEICQSVKGVEVV